MERCGARIICGLVEVVCKQNWVMCVWAAGFAPASIQLVVWTTLVSPVHPCWWLSNYCLCWYVLRDHPTVIKRRFTSVLIVSALSPLFVWAWREFTDVRVSSCPTLSLHSAPDFKIEVMYFCLTLLSDTFAVVSLDWACCFWGYLSVCLHVRLTRRYWLSWGSGLRASFLPSYFLFFSPW